MNEPASKLDDFATTGSAALRYGLPSSASPSRSQLREGDIADLAGVGIRLSVDRNGDDYTGVGLAYGWQVGRTDTCNCFRQAFLIDAAITSHPG